MSSGKLPFDDGARLRILFETSNDLHDHVCDSENILSDSFRTELENIVAEGMVQTARETRYLTAVEDTIVFRALYTIYGYPCDSSQNERACSCCQKMARLAEWGMGGVEDDEPDLNTYVSSHAKKPKHNESNAVQLLHRFFDAFHGWDTGGLTSVFQVVLAEVKEFLADSGTPSTPVNKQPWHVASDIQPKDASFVLVDGAGNMIASFHGPDADKHARFVADLVTHASQSITPRTIRNPKDEAESRHRDSILQTVPGTTQPTRLSNL